MKINIPNILFKFTLFIPILLSITNNTVDYFEARTLHPGNIAMTIIIPLLVIFLIKYYPKERISLLILLYILFYLGLSFLSSNVFESLYAFLKFFVSLMMFPLSYYFINSYERFQTLTKYYFIALLLFLINLLIANIFKLGTSDYLEDSFYFGAGRVNMTKSMIILLFANMNMIPMLTRKQKPYFISILIIGAFITLLGIKRSVLISFGVGAILFLFYNRVRYGSLKIILASLFGAMVLFLVYPKAFDLFSARFEARGERVELTDETLEKEGRVNELQLVVDTWVDGSIKHKLIGSDLFNDRQFFGARRMLHTDYAVILNGSGLIGFLLWIIILLAVYRKGNSYLKFINNDGRFPFLKPAFYSILLAQIFMSISGTIQGYGVRTFIWLYLGAIIGTLHSELRVINDQKNLSNSRLE